MSEAVDATIKDVIDRIVDVCFYSGNIIEILICILIAANFVQRKSSPILSAYFYILFFGYFFDALYEVGFTLQRYLTRDWDSDNVVDMEFIKYFESVIEWYYISFMGPSMLLLSLNRFTSIFFLTHHQVIWSSKWFLLILLSTLLYPCIIGAYTFQNIHCRMNVYNPECIDFFKEDFYRSGISNGICAILSLIVGVSTAVMYRAKFSKDTKSQSNQMKIEHKLLLQSVCSSSMFGFYALCGIFYPLFYEERDNPDWYVWQRIYNFVYDVAYITCHYVSIILLFIFSKALRKEFMKFYHLEWISDKFSKTKVSTIANSSSVRSSIPSNNFFKS